MVDDLKKRLAEAEAVIVLAQIALGTEHPVWWILDDYDGSMDAVRSVFVDWLKTDEVVMMLVNHQRKDIRSCICGWDELGQMHPKHILEKLIELFKRGGQ